MSLPSDSTHPTLPPQTRRGSESRFHEHPPKDLSARMEGKQNHCRSNLSVRWTYKWSVTILTNAVFL